MIAPTSPPRTLPGLPSNGGPSCILGASAPVPALAPAEAAGNSLPVPPHVANLQCGVGRPIAHDTIKTSPAAAGHINDGTSAVSKNVTREEAHSLGLKRYFSGKPCRHGHLGERSVASGACVGCERAYREKAAVRRADYSRRWSKLHPEKKREADKKWRATNPERSRENNRACKQRRLGIIATRPRPSVCETCGHPPGRRALHLDHNHVTGVFRGWLCRECNLALGHVHDQPEVLDALAAYLRRDSAELASGETNNIKEGTMASEGFVAFVASRIEKHLPITVSHTDRCDACGEGPVYALGPIVLTVDGPTHWRCIPTYIRKDELAAARYIVLDGEES